MVAKLIAWGEDRDTARGRAATALRALRVEGIHTNREFLIACVEDEMFAAGDVHTGFIDARRSALLARSEEQTSELQSLMRISYAVFFLKKNKDKHHINK